MNDNPKTPVAGAESCTSEEEEGNDTGDEKGDEEVPKKKEVVGSSKKMAKIRLIKKGLISNKKSSPSKDLLRSKNSNVCIMMLSTHTYIFGF